MSWEFEWLYALQDIHNPALDKVMVFVSALGNAGIFWIAVGLLLLITAGEARRCLWPWQ